MKMSKKKEKWGRDDGSRGNVEAGHLTGRKETVKIRISTLFHSPEGGSIIKKALDKDS